MKTEIVDAWHEAGHAVVGIGVGLVLDSVTIEGAVIEAGMYAGKRGRAVTNWKGGEVMVDDYLLMCLAGQFVEGMMFPEHDSCWVGDERNFIYRCWSALVAFGETQDVAREEMWMRIRGTMPGVPPEVSEYSNQTHIEVIQRLSVLFENERWWSDVRLVAEALLKRKRLTGQEVHFVLNRKVGRNEPCSCGSGLKSKKCKCDKRTPSFEDRLDSLRAVLLAR